MGMWSENRCRYFRGSNPDFWKAQAAPPWWAYRRSAGITNFSQSHELMRILFYLSVNFSLISSLAKPEADHGFSE
jgi:hypothetical protein